MELAISIIVGVLLVEAYAWLPKISEWLVERAVSQLLAEDQERCREEWKASLDALPNSGLKLLHAFSFSWAADRINTDSIEAKLEQIGHQLEDLSDEHSCTQQQVRTIKMLIAQHQAKLETLERTVDESVTSLRVFEVPVASHVIVEASVNAFESLSRKLVGAFKRASSLTDSKFYILSARTEQVDNQLRTIFAKHANATELFRKRKLSFTELAPILKNLDDDLQTLSVMMEGDVEGSEDEVRDREYKKIMTALRGVTRSIGEICNRQ